MFHCHTISQYKAYQWIKTTFNIDSISLKLLNENTILVKDMNNETVKVIYVYPKIILEYENHAQQTFYY